MAAIARPISCDSCGQPASPEHIRQRLARLELATRYRPIHIGLLLVCTAPPANLVDDLYTWEQQAASPQARDYLQGFLQCFTSGGANSPGDQLSELQRGGVFLSRLVECPINVNSSASDSKNDNLATLHGPVLIKRIQFSYKPRQIALLAPVAPGLPDLLCKAGFGPQLIAEGQGIEIPAAGDVANVARIRALLSLSTAASA